MRTTPTIILTLITYPLIIVLSIAIPVIPTFLSIAITVMPPFLSISIPTPILSIVVVVVLI